LSAAITTNATDDSYDLSWVETLPEDLIAAIATLRRLLVHERDPIDRHFMFDHLEKALYRCRDAFASALEDYDACCAQHDEEMDTIRAAFLAKWGKVPALHMYKQMCIRQAKAHDYAQALRWAKRGLALYAEDAARPDTVEDLRRRANTYQAKLAAPPRPARTRTTTQPGAEPGRQRSSPAPTAEARFAEPERPDARPPAAPPAEAEHAVHNVRA
jgi:hypothetical protein